jgi:L-ascorbate metabolism protein UlaG (beta-lactamase superfamily)
MGRFKNLDPAPARGFGDVLKWQLGKRRPDRKQPFATPRRENDGALLRASAPSLTWIGHSTFALRLGGKMIVTDPVFSERVGLTRRNVDVGVSLEHMPAIDIVCVSHAHHDHLDLPSLRRIQSHTRAKTGKPPLFVVPSEVGRYLRGFERVVERGWWESHDEEGVQLTLVPQQHWSMRGPFDRDEALWGGWVIRAEEGAAYHAGDTGYFPHFAEIGARVGAIDWAMLPIGAYDPVWFMHPQHMGPEEAGRAFLELGAKNFVCMHWGTFKLTDEPLGEPVEKVLSWWEREGPGAAARERLWLMDVGETRTL